MSKNNLQTFKRIILGFRDKDKTKIILTTYRDWKILVIVSSFLLLIIAGMNIYFSVKNEGQNNSARKDKTIEKGTVLNTDALRVTIESFDQKAENFEKLKLKKELLIDPSR